MRIRKKQSLLDDQVKTPEEKGEESIGGSSTDLEADDDVEEMYKQYFGHKPKPGTTLADEIKDAERQRRGQLDNEEQEEEE